LAAEKLHSLAHLFRETEVLIKDGLGSITRYSDGFSGFTLGYVGPRQEISISFRFRNYQEIAPTPFDFDTVIGIHFPPDCYTVTHDRKVISSNPYSKLILHEEADSLTAQILAATFEKIKFKAGAE
jgi:hypothetical protein